jgi:hypothetical protein
MKPIKPILLLAVVPFTAALLHGQTNETIEPLFITRTLPEGPIRLEWTSHPDAIYRVEVRTNLADTNWTAIELSLISQGTNTIWTD